MKPIEMEVEFDCKVCGVHVVTYRWINYRTIPASIDERELCREHMDEEDQQQAKGKNAKG